MLGEYKGQEGNYMKYNNAHSDEIEKQENLVSKCKLQMLDQLEIFKNEKSKHQKVKIDRNNEQLVNNRVIKNEVIEMADRMEKM